MFPHNSGGGGTHHSINPTRNENRNRSQRQNIIYQQPNPEFYLDPSIYFNPSDYSHISSYPPYSHSTTRSATNSTDDREPPNPKRKTRLRASRACIPCRSRHMKCDSIEPTCTRCQTEDKVCEYAKSRRGGLNRLPIDDTPLSVPQFGTPKTTTTTSSWADFRSDSSNVGTMSLLARSDIHDRNPNSHEPPTMEKLIGKFYEHFFKAHTVLLPWRNLRVRLRDDSESLALVMPVILWIGSIYLPDVSSEPYLEHARNALSESLGPLQHEPFTVQALILFSFALHCSDYYEEAYRYLHRSIDIGLEIGMHRRSFAVDHGGGDPVLEESWRRTWWSINGLDALYAGIAFEETHRLKGLPEEVDLPCEEWEYDGGIIPTPRTIQEYDEREFCTPGFETVFSSYTYCIDVGRILSANLGINNNKNSGEKPTESILAVADAKFVNWFLHLPRCKMNLVKDGKVDEIMFMAVLLINTQKLLLHRPHSKFRYHPAEQTSNCVPPIPTHAESITITFHTEKCREAFIASITLFALPSPHLDHTPIMTCGLSLAILAQVSACLHTQTPGTDEYIASRDRIKLGLGAMRASMQCWFTQSRNAREVVAIARELLAIGGGRTTGDQQSGKANSDSGSNGGSKGGSVRDSISDDGVDMMDDAI